MSKLFGLINYISTRSISLSAPREGKRNFRKFMLINKRGSRLHKLRQATRDPELPVDHRGVRMVGYELNGRFHRVPEMVPELIVPDLKGCELKPYVSYKAEDVTQTEFTAEELFEAVYSKKIVSDFKEGKLDENGDPINPSEKEKMKPEEAFQLARKTGSDIF